MAKEFETAGLASLGALKPDTAGDEPAGAPCANCGADVTGRFCGRCGQLAANFHRPIWTLVGEVLADSLSLDGRIARTLPALMLRPGHVTRAYLDGKRARYVPPFRLFLLASLVFFFTLFAVGDRLGWFEGVHIVATDSGYDLRMGNGIPEDGEQIDYIDPSGRIGPAEPVGEGEEPGGLVLSDDPETAERLARFYNNQPLFFAAVRAWTPRLSFLLLPIFILLLGFVFVFRRGVYLYDHMIAALHFQSFLYLGGAGLMWAGLALGSWVGWMALIGVPVYLFQLLRRTYASGVAMSFLRTIFLLFTTSISLLIIVISIVVVGALQV